MQIMVELRGYAKTRELLEKAEHLLKGDQRALEPAWRAIGNQALRLVQQNIISGGVRVGGWTALSPVTVLLRRRGSGAKIIDEAGLEAKRRTLSPLQDTGLLLSSFNPGRLENIFDVQALSVRVGTANRNALLHQFGGSVNFQFDDEQKKRFEQNVRKTLPGSKPRLTPTGRPSHARKNWNPFYFKTLAGLIKMKGQLYRVPARPILFELNESEQAQFVGILGDHVGRKLREL